jgi:hypothetical protein
VGAQADMLLDGAFLRELEKVLDAAKIVRRGMIRRGELQVFGVCGMSAACRARLTATIVRTPTYQVHEKHTQFVLAAATLPSAGKKSVADYVRSRFPNVKLPLVIYFASSIAR